MSTPVIIAAIAVAAVYVGGAIFFLYQVTVIGILAEWDAGRFIKSWFVCLGWPAAMLYVLWEGRWR